MSNRGSVAQRVRQIQERVAEAARTSGRQGGDVTLVAVTKTCPAPLVEQLLEAGVCHIGENRVQELCAKAPLVRPAGAVWHMIGHLQRNKIRRALEHAVWVQSVDSERLADALERETARCERELNCLVEVNMTPAENKTGAPPAVVRDICEKIAASRWLRLRGFMTIGPLTGGEKEMRSCFAGLRELAVSLGDLCPAPELSMGMSSDFEWAIEEGATMVRIGSLLTGGYGG